MLLPLRGRRRLGVAVAVVTAAVVGPLSLLSTQSATAAPPPTAASAPTDRTSPLEARRVDRVDVGTIKWSSCGRSTGECAEIQLPLDYDEPNGPTTRVYLGRTKAAKPEQRIGTLFINPGGPGNSAAPYGANAALVFGRQLLDRFDIVGVDPRGIGNGDKVRCFSTAAEQRVATAGLFVGFPVTPAETREWGQSSRALAKACGTTGRPLAASVSTAEVARDMDVVRRALGEKSLTFLGFSYGTQLGQVYANMFPDRVRTMALDGVIDPVAWTTGYDGTDRTIPFSDRMRTADGMYSVFRELLRRCDTVGAPRCAFAGSGDSLKKFDVLAGRLKKTPVTFQNQSITYGGLVNAVASGMYAGDVGTKLTAYLQDLYAASDPTVLEARRAAAGRRAVAGGAELRAAVRPNGTLSGGSPRAEADEAYDYGLDARSAVICSDAVHLKALKPWIAAAEAADRRVPYFGSRWSWGMTWCAGSIWTARDEDRYLGPFTRRTANPVLFVGNYYDPGTPYTYGAVAASKLLPSSRLLSSDSWGHTAYFNNTCVSSAVETYLIDGTLPAKGAVCTGPQPFEPTTVAPQAQRGSSSVPRLAPIQPYVAGRQD